MPDRDLLARCDADLAAGNYAAAIDSAREVLSRDREVDDPGVRLAAAAVLASAYRNTLQHEDALQAALTMRSLAEDLGDSVASLRALHHLGCVYTQLRRPQDAFRFLQEGIQAETIDPATYRQFCAALADVYMQVGDHHRAEFLCARAEHSLTQQFGEDARFSGEGFRWHVEGRLRLARIAESRRQFFDAREKLLGLIESAEMGRDAGLGWTTPRDAKEINDYWAEVEALVRYYLGRYLRNTGQLQAAWRSLKLAETLADQQDDPSLLLLILEQQGAVAREGGAQAEAQALYERALILLEEGLPRLRVEEFRIAVRAAGQKVYEQLVLGSITMDRQERAWECVEKSRARILLNRLGSDELVKSSPRVGGVGGIGEQYVQIGFKLAEVQERLRRAPAGVDRDRLRSRTGELRRRKIELVQSMRRASPMDAAILEMPIASSSEVARRIGPDTAIAEYFVTPDAVVLLLLTSEGLVITGAPVKREALRRAVARARTLIAMESRPGGTTTESRNEFNQLSIKLFGMLIGGAARRISGVTRLIVVAHDILHRLPFSVLRDHDGWLIEKVHLIRAASASILNRLLQLEPRVAPRTVAIFANPEPQAAPLRFADTEAKRIKEIFPSAEVFPGERATAERFREHAEKCDLLHLACHADFDADAPLLSQLRLAPDVERKRPGTVDVHQIHALRLKAGLVVLSACETGLSEISDAEELHGLVQAFTVAGASSVIASLWSVADLATAVLMGALYGYLASNHDRAAALNLAQLDILASEAYAAPFYWSAFELHGDWRTERDPAADARNADIETGGI